MAVDVLGQVLNIGRLQGVMGVLDRQAANLAEVELETLLEAEGILRRNGSGAELLGEVEQLLPGRLEAFRQGRLDRARALLAAKANVHLKDNNGKTALDLVQAPALAGEAPGLLTVERAAALERQAVRNEAELRALLRRAAGK